VIELFKPAVAFRSIQYSRKSKCGKFLLPMPQVNISFNQTNYIIVRPKLTRELANLVYAK